MCGLKIELFLIKYLVNVISFFIFDICNISAYDKKKKSPKQAPEIPMASNSDIKVITGIKLTYLSEKINEYGTNHMFQLLDESPFKELIALGDMKTYLGIRW